MLDVMPTIKSKCMVTKHSQANVTSHYMGFALRQNEMHNYSFAQIMPVEIAYH